MNMQGHTRSETPWQRDERIRVELQDAADEHGLPDSAGNMVRAGDYVRDRRDGSVAYVTHASVQRSYDVETPVADLAASRYSVEWRARRPGSGLEFAKSVNLVGLTTGAVLLRDAEKIDDLDAIRAEILREAEARVSAVRQMLAHYEGVLDSERFRLESLREMTPEAAMRFVEHERQSRV